MKCVDFCLVLARGSRGNDRLRKFLHPDPARISQLGFRIFSNLMTYVYTLLRW